MVEPAENRTVLEEAKRLSQVSEQLMDMLRSQRDSLRQRGMSLPSGVLDGLQEVQAALNKLADQLSEEAVELGQFRALAETTALINSSLDLNQVLNEVMDTVIRLTGAERGYIMLRDEDTGQMEYHVARNLDRKTIDEGSFVISRTIVQEVAQTGQPVVTTNAQSDPRFSAQESVLIFALRSILCVPLIVKDEVTGVVYADNRIRSALFGEKELSLLVAFANQAAIAIENARLFQRVQTALAESTAMKELMDNVFASIASGVITTDAQETITSYNVAAERIFQTSAPAALGHRLSDTLPAIYSYIENLFALVYERSYQEMIEIEEQEMAGRGEVALNLKLAPLKNEGSTEGVAIVVDDLTEIKRRDATLDVVRRYLPPAMVDNIESIDSLGLGGERRLITVLFVETRPLNSFSTDLSPQEVMELVNLYLSVGAEAIHHQNGVIDKFMGNEIMGLFNTQLNPSTDHAWWAVQAALKMVDDYRALAERQGRALPPYYRIGIHTGVATLGNVGSPTRRDFTAIGDSVNLAKRLQENAEPGEIIISGDACEHCYTHLTDPTNGIQVVERSNIQVKGRRQATIIYEIQR